MSSINRPRGFIWTIFAVSLTIPGTLLAGQPRIPPDAVAIDSHSSTVPIYSPNELALSKIIHVLSDQRIYHGIAISPARDSFISEVNDYIALTKRRPAVVVFFAHAFNSGKPVNWDWYSILLKRVDQIGAIPFVKATTADWDTKSNKWWSAKDILAGKYDSYLIRAAQVCRQFSKPIFLSWNHEMNGDWYPYSEAYQNRHPETTDWTAELYVMVWRYIWDIFQREQATNVAFAWGPSVTGRPLQGFDEFDSWIPYWPGDGFVDWIAPSIYNHQPPERLHYFVANFPNKPIFVSEWGTSASRTKWYRPWPYPGDAHWMQRFFDTIHTAPNIRGIAYFHWTPAYAIQRSADQVPIYRNALDNSRFFHGHDH